MKRKKVKEVEEDVVDISKPISEMSLEEFEEIIYDERFEGEVPFDLLAEYYPELLVEWYPGFPGLPRPITEQDPVPAWAQVQNKKITIDLPGAGKTPEYANDNLDDGKYIIWLRKSENGEWNMCGLCFAEVTQS